MVIENVYYRLWSKDVFSLARNPQSADIIKSKACCNIRDNNQAFLNELEKRKLDGAQSVAEWLERLLEDFVKRCNGIVIHVWNPKETDYCYYEEWLNNTLCICDTPVVVRFCKDFEKTIKVLSSDEIPYDGNEEFKEFRDKLGFLLGKDNTESLYRALPSMKPKQVKPYYNEHKRIQEYFSKTEFADICRHYGHHENQEGWGDRNLRG